MWEVEWQSFCFNVLEMPSYEKWLIVLLEKSNLIIILGTWRLVGILIHCFPMQAAKKQELGDAVILYADDNIIETEYNDIGSIPPDVVCIFIMWQKYNVRHVWVCLHNPTCKYCWWGIYGNTVGWKLHVFIWVLLSFLLKHLGLYNFHWQCISINFIVLSARKFQVPCYIKSSSFNTVTCIIN